MRLAEHGELNQSRLVRYCGLNLVKHREIIDELVRKGMIEKRVEPLGNKSTVIFSITEKGSNFFKMILEPYEEMFPRIEDRDNSDNAHDISENKEEKSE